MFFRRPRFALLDEPTSGVSSDVLKPLFAKAKQLGITMVTISHQTELRELHERELTLAPGGAWELTTIEGGECIATGGKSDDGGVVLDGETGERERMGSDFLEL